MNAKEKVIVITGAASGIGRATARKFAREGARVVVSDLNEAGGMETVDLIKKDGGEAVYIKTDVANLHDVENAVNFAVDTYGRIDVMFNNAGTSGKAPLLELNPEIYDRVIKVNQYGVYYGIVAAARKMKDLGINGIIVNNGSVYGFLASEEGSFSYHTSKAAVKMMTQCAALELAQYSIRVIGIAPGFVDTPISKSKDRASSKHMRKELIKPEAIADAVYLLCLKEANVINGSTVMLDDGYSVFK